MYLNNIEKNTSVNPLAEEIKLGLDNKDHDKAVLLLHGFGGRTSNWQYIGKRIYEEENIPVYIPRLPGHGTNLSDFLNSGADQWLRKSFDSYLYLKRNYKDIYVAGLSMGGILAAIIASEFEVKKLSMAAPAFYTTSKTIVFTPILKYFIQKIDNDFVLENEEELSEEAIHYHNNYSKDYYPKQLAELYKLMLKARKSAEKIKVPTQLILTENDELVDTAKINKFLNKKMGHYLTDIKIYQETPHVITNSIEKERCADDIIKFFKEAF